MPQLKVGDDAPNFILPAIDGTSFDMSNFKGKRVILTFFRFSTCPFCNIRINRILKRWDEFDDDTVMVGVFDAKIDELKKGKLRVIVLIIDNPDILRTSVTMLNDILKKMDTDGDGKVSSKEFLAFICPCCCK